VQLGTRPQTMYGLADSPVALAARTLNHNAASYSDIAAAFAGHHDGCLLSRTCRRRRRGCAAN